MNEDHAELEADWLAGELERALKHIRDGNAIDDPNKALPYYAGVEQILLSLFNHYRVEPYDEADPSQDPTYHSQRQYQKERGPVGRLILGKRR